MKKTFKNLIISFLVISLSLMGIGYNEVNQAKAASPLTVDLGTAGNFSVLGKTAITTTGATSIIGNIGVSPAAAVSMTGFGLIMDSSGQFSTSALVTGKVYASDYANPTPANMTTAISDMESAYTDAAGRPGPTATEIDAGILSSTTPAFIAGIYKWSTDVTITDNITLSGSDTDIWIFQIAGDLELATAGSLVDGTKILLSGGAKADNVFWQVGGLTGATLGTYSTFNGNILSAKQIILETGAVLNGRALSQTQVTLDANTISSSPATLRVIKLVINDVDGVAVPSDFTITVKKLNNNVVGSPMLGTSTPGTSYSLAPGTYIVDEDDNSAYTKTFSGDCSATGSVVLLAGDNKTCTIINTNIPVIVPTPPSGGGGGSPVPIIPLIGVTKTPSPLSLSGPGSVTYNYTVWNVGGERALGSITVTDDKCAPLTLVSGDLNQNFKIEPLEVWKYTCTTNLSITTTNTVVATGKSDDPYQQTATATAIATVIVGSTPFIAIATTTPVITTTPGVVTPPTIVSSVTTTVPTLPNTGLDSKVNNSPWNIVVPVGIVLLTTVVLVIALKKREV